MVLFRGECEKAFEPLAIPDMRIVARQLRGPRIDANLSVTWSMPEAPLRLNKNDVHVWRASIDVSPEVQSSLACLLDGGEKRRANQFVFERDRNHFIAAHGIVRTILGEYLQRPPEELQVTVERYGKPALRKEPGCSDVRFNLSHSGGVALLAVALENEVGIDLEKIRSGVADEVLAASILTPSEQDEFRSTPIGERQREFFRRWTCKEAYVKAQGGGLQIPLKSFEVSLPPEEFPRLCCEANDSWDLVSFCPGENFMAALAIQAKNSEVRFWNWS